MKENTSIRLKKYMEINGINQTELTKRLKMPKSTVSQYVSGKREPNTAQLYMIGQALNVSEVWLMGYDVPMKDELLDENEGDLLAEVYNDSEMLSYIEKLNKLTQEQRKVIYNMIDALSN